tara:strand:- start:3230 stop:4087 length:858 start_codon:yes stop_codon:yes gene_type:complete
VVKYENSLKILLFSIIAVQIALYFFEILRPSIIYDYIDYFPFTIIPLSIYLFLIYKKINSRLYVYLSTYLAVVFIFFPIANILKADFLTTYSFPSFIENRNLDRDSNYLLIIDIDGVINLNTFNESGYTADIINRPGEIGYPEAVETLIGEPRAVLIRELETSSLLKISGWDINLGNKNTWKLDLVSFDSDLNLDDIKLENSEISGTGNIYLGKELELKELKINGNFDIKVSKDLPIVVVGKVETPASWISATIGYLNQANEVYKLKVFVEDGSNVKFFDENGES